MKPSLLIAATIIIHGSLDTFAFSDLFCSNDSSFRFTYKGETRDCQWIVPQSDEVTKTLCRDMTIRSNCLHSCGLCCEDNIFYRIQTLDGQYKTCSWIAQDDATKLQYCNLKQNGIFLREVCAATCNNCEPFIPLTEEPSGAPTAPPTILPPPPTAAPSWAKTERPSVHVLEPCTDNPHFVFVLQNGVQQNCAWIQSNSNRVQDRQEKYCPDQDIFDNCQGACEACVENNSNNNNNNNNNNHTLTATPTAAPSKTTKVTFAPTLRPSPQPNVPSLSPTQPRTTSPTIAYATPSKHPSPTHNNDNNNGSNQEEESFPSGTITDQESRGSNAGEETEKKKNNSNKSGSTAAWVLSFMGVFFIIGAVVRIVGKRKQNNVTKTQVMKKKRGTDSDQGSSWIVTFLSGSLCSDISYDDEE